MGKTKARTFMVLKQTPKDEVNIPYEVASIPKLKLANRGCHKPLNIQYRRTLSIPNDEESIVQLSLPTMSEGVLWSSVDLTI